MTPRWIVLAGLLLACDLAQGQADEPSPARWHYEGEMQRLAEPVGIDDACGDWNSTLDSSGHVLLQADSVVLEGLGCTLPLGDGTDTTLHPCTDSDQLKAWTDSGDADLLPSLSFQPVQLDRETGAFFLAGEAIHGDEKVCFQTTGTATRVE